MASRNHSTKAVDEAVKAEAVAEAAEVEETEKAPDIGEAEEKTPVMIANGTIEVGGIVYHTGDRIPNADPAELSEAISSCLVYVIEGGAAQ